MKVWLKYGMIGLIIGVFAITMPLVQTVTSKLTLLFFNPKNIFWYPGFLMIHLGIFFLLGIGIGKIIKKKWK